MQPHVKDYIALAKYLQVEHNLEEEIGMVLTRGSLLMMVFERFQ